MIEIRAILYLSGFLLSKSLFKIISSIVMLRIILARSLSISIKILQYTNFESSKLRVYIVLSRNIWSLVPLCHCIFTLTFCKCRVQCAAVFKWTHAHLVCDHFVGALHTFIWSFFNWFRVGKLWIKITFHRLTFCRRKCISIISCSQWFSSLKPSDAYMWQ